MRRHLTTRPAFTLVEVIAVLGIVVFLMAALFQAMISQSRYSEIATERMDEAQIARTLLHQIAEEIRSVTPPVSVPLPKDPARARSLLALGDLTPIDDSLTSAFSPFDTSKESAPPPLDTSIAGTLSDAGATLGGPERFALLGTTNRLLIMAHLNPESRSSLDLYKESQGDSTTSTATMGIDQEDKRHEPGRWGDLRQIFYLLRPIPEMLERKDATAVPEPLDATADGSITAEEQYESFYAGIIRQEIKLPFSLFAQDDAVYQLQEHLFPEEESGFEMPELPTTDTGLTVDSAVPLPPHTQTEVLTERVSAIRFRYYDGSTWMNSWSDANRLPIAVEISLSFDPRAADPQYLKTYFEEHGDLSTPASGQAALVAPPAVSGEEQESPLFPYRLVVAIPAATRAPKIVTQEGMPPQGPPPPPSNGNPPPPGAGSPPPGIGGAP